MKRLSSYVREHKYTLFLLVFWPIQLTWYQSMRIFSADMDVVLFQSPLDACIPFCEWFVIPYVMWYPFIALITFLSLRSGRKAFWQTQAFVVGCLWLPMIFITLVPNGIPYSLQPDFAALGRSNLLIDTVKLIYAGDYPPRNCMPSMHVSLSLGLFFAVMKNKGLKGKWALKLAVFVIAVLISLSTVFIKQHSVLDLFAGTGVALFVLVVVSIGERFIFKK